jgi:polysaccharide deacetylase family protein (PEP-CTERM system associated)
MSGRANSADDALTHLVSFDIEGFVEASHDSFRVPEKYISEPAERREIHENTEVILDILDECQVSATFFMLGRLGRDMPGLVREVAERGHEIAAHSFTHRRLYLFDRPGAQEQLRLAKDQLEQACGAKVVGFRAPDFSIVRENLYLLDDLREVGYEYDSSVYPLSFHDAYGISSFPRHPFILPSGLIEFPMSTVSVGSMALPYGGGGYLRLYPNPLTKALVRYRARQGLPTIVYLHPVEMGKVVPRIREISLARRFRTYVGMQGARHKLRDLLKTFRFVSFATFLANRPALPRVQAIGAGIDDNGARA